MPAVPVHHVATDDGAWDGPAQEKKLKTPLTKSIGNRTFAWSDPDGDGTHKSDYRYIHHFVSAAGLPGSASTLACSTGIGILNGARTGTTIPDKDRQGVYNHLVAHLRDAGVKEADLPELKSHKAPAASVRSEMREVPETRVSSRSEFELREIPNGTGGTNLRFTGFACVTDAEYEMEDYLGPWVESVNVGAFGKTLTEGADVAFLLNHEGMTLARTKSGTLKLSEETDGARSPVYGVTGLHSEALLDPLNPMVRAMRSAVERSDLDSMSFAFRVTSQEWNEDFTRRRIQAVNLDFGDVSLVNYPGNPHTAGSVSLRQRFRGFGPRTFRAVEDEDLCNRCGGDGSISLQGKTVPCPQCKGSGTGENNATVTDAELKAMAQRARLRLAQLRYPPGDPGRRIAAFEPQSHRGRLERLRHPPR